MEIIFQYFFYKWSCRDGCYHRFIFLCGAEYLAPTSVCDLEGCFVHTLTLLLCTLKNVFSNIDIRFAMYASHEDNNVTGSGGNVVGTK